MITNALALIAFAAAQQVSVVSPTWGTVGPDALVRVRGNVSALEATYLEDSSGALLGPLPGECERGWHGESSCTFSAADAATGSSYRVLVYALDAGAEGGAFVVAEGVEYATAPELPTLVSGSVELSEESEDTGSDGVWVTVTATWSVASAEGGGWLGEARNAETGEIMGWWESQATATSGLAFGRYAYTGQDKACMEVISYDPSGLEVDAGESCVDVPPRAVCGCGNAAGGRTLPALATAGLFLTLRRRRGYRQEPTIHSGPGR